LGGGREERINGKSLEAFQNKKMESLFLVSSQEVTVFLLCLQSTLKFLNLALAYAPDTHTAMLYTGKPRTKFRKARTVRQN
jgi:hypothetical protein